MTDESGSLQSTIDAAMRTQLANLANAMARGVPRLGWKVGFHDEASQARLGLPSPLMGVLDGSRVFPAGGVYHPRPGAKVLAEVEIALTIGQPVSAEATLEEARAAIASVAPAFELIDVTKPGPRRSAIGELVANGIMHDATAFGADQPYAAFEAMLAAGLPKLSRGGEPVREGEQGRVPDDVATVVLSAARILERYGDALQAGDRIICGSYIDPLEVSEGDELLADLGPAGQLAITIGKTR